MIKSDIVDSTAPLKWVIVMLVTSCCWWQTLYRLKLILLFFSGQVYSSTGSWANWEVGTFYVGKFNRKLVSSDWCLKFLILSNFVHIFPTFNFQIDYSNFPTNISKDKFCWWKICFNGYIAVGDGCWSRKYCHQHHCSRQ